MTLWLEASGMFKNGLMVSNTS